MIQLQLAYQIANIEQGTKEITGSLSNDRIIEYHATTTLKATADEVEWCSAFVNWCFLMAGIIINPGLAQKRMTGIYSEQEIMTFCRSAQGLAQKLNIPFSLIDDSKISIRMPTRSAAARSWLKFGQECEFFEGCLVILWRGTPNGWQGHVGFAKKKGVTTIEILGGNQGNKVGVDSYSRLRLLGFRA